MRSHVPPRSEVRSKQGAIDATVRFMELHKDHPPGWEGEAGVREIFEAPR